MRRLMRDVSADVFVDLESIAEEYDRRAEEIAKEAALPPGR